LKASKIQPTTEWTVPPTCKVTAPRLPVGGLKPRILNQLRTGQRVSALVRRLSR
jgi:hypothetical protein